jgi:hypothetical protein
MAEMLFVKTEQSCESLESVFEMSPSSASIRKQAVA